MLVGLRQHAISQQLLPFANWQKCLAAAFAEAIPPEEIESILQNVADKLFEGPERPGAAISR
jgi:hypothetical protein